MIVIGIMLIVGALGALSVSLGLVLASDSASRERLVGPKPKRGRRRRDTSTDEDGSIAERLHVDGPEDVARFIVPLRMRERIDRNLLLAGHPPGWTWQKIVLLKALVPVFLLLALYQYSFTQLDMIRTGVGVAAVIVGYFLPDLLLSSRATERQADMEADLPDALDKIVVSIEAGLGFEAALLRVAETGDGELAGELMRTIQDIRVGMGRRVAYEAFAARTSSDDIRRFVRSIIQAEETGVSVAQVVRTQSSDMRLKRKLRAEGKAQQVSVKLLFPLLVCVFPVLFVVVLAPGVMTAIDTFKGT